MRIKTVKAMAKRIIKTKSGKIKRKKSASRKRRHFGLKNISPANNKQIKKLVPY